MDKIYSRKRIRIPKIMYKKINNQENKRKSKIIKITTILIIAVITGYTIIQTINPMINKTCVDKAKSIATIISNSEATSIMKDYEYEDLINIYKDKDDNITMIKANIISINKIISDVGERIQKRIDSEDYDSIKINLGSITGSKLLNSRGPEIPIKISIIGNVETDFKSEFKSAGINQTLHRLYLQVDCKISILTPYDNIEENISNQVILAENVIVGKIPNTYYNLENAGEQGELEVIQ